MGWLVGAVGIEPATLDSSGSIQVRAFESSGLMEPAMRIEPMSELLVASEFRPMLGSQLFAAMTFIPYDG